MAQEDKLKREIDKLANALSNLLASLTGFNNQGKTQEAVNYANERLKTELGFDLDEFAALANDDLIATLANTYHLNNGRLGLLADIIYKSARALQQSEADQSIKLFEKALMLYQYVAANEKNYSFDWHNKITELKKIV
jgi:hypothetical protein